MLTALSLLSTPCSSRFAASVYAGLAQNYCLPIAVPIYRRSLHQSARLNQIKSAQPQTSATEHIELTAPATYISESQDPWFNLSYEDWLLRNTPRNQPVLFFYRNKPCVVIGRNQNPWQESTPRDLAEWDIPLIRRRSGGGTVFHDLGNTNFSLILPRLLFTRSHGAELVSRAIRDRLGITQCTVNGRNDVIIRDSNKDFKVSGSAYKIIQHRAYHHGTMLISSSLDDLGKALRSSSPNIQGKSVPSFRSPVTTLNNYLPPSRSPLVHEDFIDAVTQEFALVYSGGKDKQMAMHKVTEGDKGIDDKVWKGVEELKSWEWTYGQTPEFSNDLEADLSFGKVSASLTARHALIQSITFHFTPPLTSNSDSDRSNRLIQDQLDNLALSLVGLRYATLDDISTDHLEQQDKLRRDEVIHWLKSNM